MKKKTSKQAKKQPYSKKQLKPVTDKLKKLRKYSKLYEKLKDTPSKKGEKFKFRIDTLSKWENKYEAEIYLKEQRKALIKKLDKSKMYKGLKAFKSEQTESKRNTKKMYFLNAFRFWQKDNLIEYLDEKDYTSLNGISNERIDLIFNEIDFYFMQLDSSKSIKVYRDEQNKFYIKVE
jgi:hypothetical protein